MIQEIKNSASMEQFKDDKSLENMETKDSMQEYSNFSLKELIKTFEDLLQKGDQQEMYKHADNIKAVFYKTLKKEKIAAGMTISDQMSIKANEEDNISDNDMEETTDTESDNNDSTLDKISKNPFAEMERGFKELYSKYKEMRTQYVEEMERQKEINLKTKLDIIDELKDLIDKQEDINTTFPAFRELQNRWKASGSVPPARNKDLWETYQFLVEKFYDFVKINNELRDLDLKKNLELKVELCIKAEQLLENSNIVEAFKELQQLHDEWRELGPVPKDQREEVWERFKTATSAINRKQQQFFEGIKAEQKNNLELKARLCEKAESIADSNKDDKDWNQLSKEMESLQEEWKGIGFASKKENQKIYDRFRAACDKFYDQKREFYANFKRIMQENFDKKVALCEQAESLMNSDDWKKTTDQLISLQKKWKEIGPVARKQSDAIWKRFRAACDQFFNKKTEYFKDIESSYEQNLAQKKELIEEINAFITDKNKSDNFEALKDFQARWNSIGFVPLKEKDKIVAAYRNAIDQKFADIKDSDNEHKFIRFRKHINELKGSPKSEKSLKFERDKLLQKFRQIEQDIALWENNMGFFTKSKKADSILTDIEKKIEKAKEELLQIEEKIKLIDKQYE